MYELIHTEDRAEFQRQLHWALNPQQCPDSGQRIDGKNVYQKVVLGIEFSERRQRIFRGMELHSEDEEECVWDTGGPLGLLSVITSCLVIKVNGKLQQPNPGRTTNGPDPSGMMA